MVIVLLVGLAIGLGNGLLVEYAKIDSFIATLGLGTIMYGLANWYTAGRQIVTPLPQFVRHAELFGTELVRETAADAAAADRLRNPLATPGAAGREHRKERR